ncbi:MAG: methylmalonyl Co-A mutase-associated GTPase MeaB [Acidimicrobiales bacterium]
MADTRDPSELLAAARGGDRGALARMLSMVERGGEKARSVGRVTYPLGGTAYTVGLTGAPGAGKSTLTGRLITEVRAGGDAVAVLAIDPSSPFSGGAILGDRVRMDEHTLDDGVFIRSMATRGHLGGLALAAPEAVRALDAAGFPWVFIETVGVGQVELEVATTADTTVVVVNPGWGDAVQAAKAGLLEIADVFVINKADRPGAAEAQRDLEHVLALSTGPAERWQAPIVRTVATADGGGNSDGSGAGEVFAAVRAHRAWLSSGGRLEAKRATRIDDELEAILVARLRARVRATGVDEARAHLHSEVAARRLDPWSAADELLAAITMSDQ